MSVSTEAVAVAKVVENGTSPEPCVQQGLPLVAEPNDENKPASLPRTDAGDIVPAADSDVVAPSPVTAPEPEMESSTLPKLDDIK